MWSVWSTREAVCRRKPKLTQHVLLQHRLRWLRKNENNDMQSWRFSFSILHSGGPGGMKLFRVGMGLGLRCCFFTHTLRHWTCANMRRITRAPACSRPSPLPCLPPPGVYAVLSFLRPHGNPAARLTMASPQSEMLTHAAKRTTLHHDRQVCGGEYSHPPVSACLFISSPPHVMQSSREWN